jgi:HPt (histidine-containing phosphotransfer) domain-containing protein
MNGFISKPVSREALWTELERWLPALRDEAQGIASAGKSDPVASAPQPPEQQLFDLGGVMSRMMGDRELAAAVMGAFLDDMPRQIEALKEYLQTGNQEGCARQAHSVKGAASNVGGERLRAVALVMEKAADAGDLSIVAEQMKNLEDQFSFLRNAVLEEIKSNRDLNQG